MKSSNNISAPAWVQRFLEWLVLKGGLAKVLTTISYNKNIINFKPKFASDEKNILSLSPD
jgi:hypothetical protein